MRKWRKKGLIYCPSGKNGFDYSHCHKPTPLLIDENTLRVYFGVRDKTRKTRTTFVDLSLDDLGSIKYVHNKPILDLGKIGAFDDSGANVSSVCRNGDEIYMYFIGWNPSTTVHTRNSVGLAVSRDNGFTFERMYDGPVLDRTKDEPYYTGAVDVINEKDIWKVWYTSGSEWKIINGRPEIFYHIKYGTSKNGIDWKREDAICIPPSDEFEVTARPSVIKDRSGYKMWYSKRNLVDFRTEAKQSYRPGYAESEDGVHWQRLDEKLDLSLSDEGWDSEAIAYPYVREIGGKLVMLYNGNGFGATGFGYAVYE
jgi:predicted GH43/DUF377 family glycosyl hydrolase